jgi:hypothetical protein
MEGMCSSLKGLSNRLSDVGASPHLRTHQSINTHGAHSSKGEASPSHFGLENLSMMRVFNVDKLEKPSCAFAQARDKVSIKWLMVGRICI